MSFSIFTKFKATDGITPAFRSMIVKGNSFQAQAGRLKNSFANTFRSIGAYITSVRMKFSALTDRIFTIKNALMGSFVFLGLQQAFNAVKNFSQQALTAVQAQTTAETKLYAVLKNVRSIQAQGPDAYKLAGDRLKTMASELQKIGIIGDEITLAGFQQLATFQMSDKEIGILSKGMTDLLAQQKGLNAQQSDAVNIANLMGKVMDGQVGALRRVGVSFTKAEEHVLKTGTRLERASMLAKVLQNNVGGVNEALAQAPEGKVKNMTNLWGDMHENIGMKLMPILADFAGWFAPHIPQIEAFIIKLIDKFVNFVHSVIDTYNNIKRWYDFTIRNSDRIVALLSGIASAAIIANFNSLAWAVLGLSLKMWSLTTSIWANVTAIGAQTAALMLNPFTPVAIAIVGLVSLIVMLIKHWDELTWRFKQKFANPLKDLTPEQQKKLDAYNKEHGTDIQNKVPGFASGTDYFSGGLALVGEKGPEFVRLPGATKVYNNSKTVSMIEKLSRPRFDKIIDFEKYRKMRDEKQILLKETIIKETQEAQKENVIYLELDLKLPEGADLKVVNARSDSGRDFKVRLKGKSIQ